MIIKINSSTYLDPQIIDGAQWCDSRLCVHASCLTQWIGVGEMESVFRP